MLGEIDLDSRQLGVVGRSSRRPGGFGRNCATLGAIGCGLRILGGFGHSCGTPGAIGCGLRLGGLGRNWGILGAIGRGLRLGGFGRNWGVPVVMVAVLGRVTCLLEGRLGSNSCKAFRFLFPLVRQELQVDKILPVEVAEKQDSRRF